jgi:hypothetical protein
MEQQTQSQREERRQTQQSDYEGEERRKSRQTQEAPAGDPVSEAPQLEADEQPGSEEEDAGEPRRG